MAVPTRRVHHAGFPDPITINATAFDPAIHTLLDDDAPVAEAADDTTTDKAPSAPKRKGRTAR